MSEPTVSQQIEELKVNKFFITALEDENLLSQLETALNTKDDATILGLAQEHGYNLTLESLHQELKKIANLVAPIALVEKE